MKTVGVVTKFSNSVNTTIEDSPYKITPEPASSVKEVKQHWNYIDFMVNPSMIGNV